MPLWLIKIGLNLVGLKIVASKFVKNNWKWLLPLVAVVVLYFWGSHEFNKVKEAAYKQGVVAENTRWNKLVAEEDKRNREFEAKLADMITKYGYTVIDKSAKRVEKETTVKEQIKTIVQNNPVYEQCVVDQSVIEKRNEIRRLGPSINRQIEDKTDE